MRARKPKAAPEVQYIYMANDGDCWRASDCSNDREDAAEFWADSFGSASYDYGAQGFFLEVSVPLIAKPQQPDLNNITVRKV